MTQKTTALGQAERGGKSQVTDSEAEQEAGKKPVIVGLISPSEAAPSPLCLHPHTPLVGGSLAFCMQDKVAIGYRL